MIARPRLTRANNQAIKGASDPGGLKQRATLSDKLEGERQEAIASWYEQGGEYALTWVAKYYRTPSGQKLRWEEPWFKIFTLLFLNPWVERLVVIKGGQMGYTEVCVALQAFALAKLHVPIGFVLEEAGKKLDIVGPRIQGAFQHCKPIIQLQQQQLEVFKKEDTSNKTRNITVAGVPLTIAHASTASNPSEVPPALSSFTAWIMECDEIERWRPDRLSIPEERQSACQMPSKPIRWGSTPGRVGGPTSIKVEKAQFFFDWQIVCPGCSRQFFLNPFGHFLKPQRINDAYEYYDITGCPYDWHAKDTSTSDRKVETACLGCAECGTFWSFEAIEKGEYVDKRTGIRLEDFLVQVTQEKKVIDRDVAVRMPRLASKVFNPPRQIVKLLDSENRLDAYQQGLGIAISIGTGKIDEGRLLECVGRPLPDDLGEPTFTTMGVDQGKGMNWVMVERWWMDDTIEDVTKRWKAAYSQIVWYGQVGFGGPPASFDPLDDIVRQWGVDWTFMDADPESNLAKNYAENRRPFTLPKGQVILLDQVVLDATKDYNRRTKDPARRSMYDPPEPPKPSEWAIHRTWGLDAVRDAIDTRLVSFPPGLKLVLKDQGNFLYHFVTSDRDTENNWVCPEGLPDHWFHASNFSRAGALIQFFEPRPREIPLATIPYSAH